MGDVAILEAAHHMHDGIDLADVCEELVAEALPLGSTAHDAGNVHESDPCRNDLLRFADDGQPVEPIIGHGHIAHVRFDGAERVIGRLRRRRLRQRVEEGRLADIRQADDTAFETHGLVRSGRC